ncbi:MAG: hypothetical protein HC840_12745 [Leptolyngbyaceae cyanobacterium RM2_2_4]|nr:hypothetical protein [Leptolyngbyaceae cyanobacterium RM2_2_4]
MYCPHQTMKQPNVPGQRLRSPSPPPKRLRSIRCTGVVSWIAPPIAPNHSTSAPHRRLSLPPPPLSPERLATPPQSSTTVTTTGSWTLWHS